MLRDVRVVRGQIRRLNAASFCEMDQGEVAASLRTSPKLDLNLPSHNIHVCAPAIDTTLVETPLHATRRKSFVFDRGNAVYVLDLKP
jgi:hypothetical protein